MKRLIPLMIVVLPTWIITAMLWPFLPKEHPWKKNGQSFFTLADWALGATNAAVFISMMLWVSMLILATCAAVRIASKI